MQTATARRVGVALAVVLGAALLDIPTLSAQIQNPIRAARDAFNKARQEEEQRRQQQKQQQGQPQTQPSSQPQTQRTQQAAPAAGAPAAAAGDCCSPEALRRLAASSGFVDVFGVKLGMTLDQAAAAIKAGNPALQIDIHDAFVRVFPASDQQTQVHRGLIAHTPRGRNPSFYFGPDGAFEVIGVQVAYPPGPQSVEVVSRYINFANNAPVARATILAALRQKYGTESLMEGNRMSWVYDSSGKPLSTLGNARACVFSNARLPLDIRDGGGLGAAGASWGVADEGTTRLGGSNFHDPDTAKCLGLTVVNAELGVTSLEGTMLSGFEVTAWSPAIGHNSMAATNMYITQEIARKAQEEKDAAAKRGAPKL